MKVSTLSGKERAKNYYLAISSTTALASQQQCFFLMLLPFQTQLLFAPASSRPLTLSNQSECAPQQWEHYSQSA